MAEWIEILFGMDALVMVDDDNVFFLMMAVFSG